MDNPKKFPRGFGIILLQNIRAAQYFHSLSPQGKDWLVEQTHKLSSPQEMEHFVENMAKAFLVKEHIRTTS